MLSGTISIYIN